MQIHLSHSLLDVNTFLSQFTFQSTYNEGFPDARVKTREGMVDLENQSIASIRGSES